MREILFRAKAINRDKGYYRSNYENGDWVYGLITRLYDERFENLPAEMTDLNGVSGIEIDHNTICQYTGITDKNGNKIWENDVVNGHEKRGVAFFQCVVKYNDRKARFDVKAMGCMFPLCIEEYDEDFFMNGLDYEVIGNTFDNGGEWLNGN